MKTLKFTKELSDLILRGEKSSTWRLFDDKDLTVGDELSLVEKVSGEVFASATITEVNVKTFATLTEDDWEGHERYPSEEAMYASYRAYYGDRITPDTEIKLISFALK
jgi:hypothetical protein